MSSTATIATTAFVWLESSKAVLFKYVWIGGIGACVFTLAMFGLLFATFAMLCNIAGFIPILFISSFCSGPSEDTDSSMLAICSGVMFAICSCAIFICSGVMFARGSLCSAGTIIRRDHCGGTKPEP